MHRRPSRRPERVHSFEITERTQISARITSSHDATLYIMRECGGEVLGCNDDETDRDTTSSRVDLTLEPGTYYAVVDGYGANASGTYELSITETALQDVATVCQAAPALVPGQPVTGNTSGRADYFQSTYADGSRIGHPKGQFRLFDHQSLALEPSPKTSPGLKFLSKSFSPAPK